MALEQRTEVEKDPHEGSWEVEQGRFQRNIYLRVVGMWQRRHRDAASWPQYRREEEGVGGPPEPALSRRERHDRRSGRAGSRCLLPRRRRQRERCTYTPAPVEVVRPDL